MKKSYMLMAILVFLGANNLFANQAKMKACLSCHGQKFEKAALGKSKVVANMTEEEIAAAIQGYKDGTYGGPMKGLMVNQVKGMPDAKRAAKHITAVIKGEKWDYSKDNHSKMSPEKFAKKKAKCMAKVDKVKDCITAAKSPSDMKNCKAGILKLSDHIKESGKKH